MKKSSALAGLLLAMVAVHQLLAVRADVVCSDMLDELSPCLGFLQGDEDTPSSECCAGVSSLVVTDADTVSERRAACECLKSAYGQINADLSTAQALPADCGVTPLPYTVSPDVDCSSIE